MKRSRLAAAAFGSALVVAGLGASVAPASADHYGRYGGRHHHHRHGGGWSPGAAAAVGVIGGLALGSIIASTRPSYGYGYGYGHPAPVHSGLRYYGSGYYGGGYYAPVPRHRPIYDPAPRYPYSYAPCRVIRRQVWDPAGGGWYWENRQVCPY